MLKVVSFVDKVKENKYLEFHCVLSWNKRKIQKYRVSQKKVRFSLEAYISASRVSNDKTKTTIGKVFQRAFQNSPWYWNLTNPYWRKTTKCIKGWEPGVKVQRNGKKLCLLFSQSLLHQFLHPRPSLESSSKDLCKTHPDNEDLTC